ncbi:shikimate dehydrogenase [Pseudorhizobium tarimense]|uniref:Shikimate dehydrogenase (NADP(+)) n=1 Tax=Pseudorhizobium tarimense TaxID=1079109 RepID=A0ABV2H8G4_9HYPH|nr:shikimate dehydrogenase [Pseudorhizobium tarimense]MCJ8519823.1 shikimate dehydrogenase [Pseudorhizobium tarimense]
MADSRETMVKAFVTGWPIKHSRSPLIHGHWLKQHRIAGEYRAEPVTAEGFPAFIEMLKDASSPYVGGNVTIPHKESAFRLADEVGPIAEELGAANTLWLQEHRLHATNTDVYGFAANLNERHPGWQRVDKAVVLGAGGASRAVIYALRERGIGEIHVVNRTVFRARELADRFGARIHAHPMEALAEVTQGAGLFVNTTSLGMDGSDVPQIDFSSMAAEGLVTDIVYVPLETPILRQANAQGMKTVDGLGMLLHQAVPGFEKWFGVRPRVDDTLRELVIEDMDAHR